MNSIQRSSRSDHVRIRALRSTLGITLGLCAALILAADLAVAYPLNVIPVDQDTCDPLGLSIDAASESAAVDELGTIGFPQNETISASYALTELVACPSNFDPDWPDQSRVVLTIENKTGLDFINLWYVSDKGTSISNIDGIVNGQGAFKIDQQGINIPLISESLGQNEIFENGEIWTFIIDGYVNDLGFSPDALASVGLVGDDSANVPGAFDGSSGSIIATVVPEPTTALLMGLGLAGLGVAGRREPSRTAPRNRRRLLAALSTFSGLLLGFTPSAGAYSILTGSGPHLIEPSPNPDPFYTSHAWTNNRITDPQNAGFLVFDPPTGSLLENPWQGNFQHTAGSGLASGSSGLNTFNFAGLNGDALSPGTLAAESLISINDLDEGGAAGTNEWLRLTARDSTNSVIQTPWLSTLVDTFGNPNGNLTPLPGWTWDGNSYLFDSQFVGTPNPGVGIRLITLLPIYELDFDKDHVNYSVAFGAQVEPIPEPNTALLVGLGLMGLTLAGRRESSRITTRNRREATSHA